MKNASITATDNTIHIEELAKVSGGVKPGPNGEGCTGGGCFPPRPFPPRPPFPPTEPQDPFTPFGPRRPR